MSEYEQIVKKVKKNPKDYTKYTQFKQEEYLPYENPEFATKAIHVGQEPEKEHGAVNVPLYLSTTFAQNGPGELKSQYDYARGNNPTSNALDEALAAVEHGKYGKTYSSGLSAIAAVLHTLNVGDHLICCDDLYGGTTRYLQTYSIPKHQIEVDYIDTTDLEKVKKAFKKNTKILWLESPTNPTLKICDLKALSEAAHQYNKNMIVVVDNTFMSPYLQNPLLLGADIVVHSLTKYVGGHSDVVMGATVTNDLEIMKQLCMAVKSFGGSANPFCSYLALRGLKSLEARMKIHCYNAYCLAHFLEKDPRVEKVYYSGLKSSPYHKTALKQQRGFGGMLTIQIKGDLREGKRFLQKLKIFTLAESLGGVESLAEIPAIMTHGGVPKELREAVGITGGLIRMSVGIENIEDILEDVDQALEFSQQSD